jgi:hypothetical protein
MPDLTRDEIEAALKEIFEDGKADQVAYPSGGKDQSGLAPQ